MKTCAYINLPGAEDRRRSLEESFARAAPYGWTLTRFEALGPGQVATIPGALTTGEKGCFASHRAVLAAHLEDDDPLMIVEDDAVFSPQTFGVLDRILAQSDDCDLIFTDVGPTDVHLMVDLASRRDDLAARSQYMLVDLAGRSSFFGSTAYVVPGSAKRRLDAALAAATELDQPYDMFLRELIHSGQFKGAVTFPFLTTVSPEADNSQIQGHAKTALDTTFNAFRRLMFVDRDLDQCRADAQRVAAFTDEAGRLTGGIFAALVSPGFPLGR